MLRATPFLLAPLAVLASCAATTQETNPVPAAERRVTNALLVGVRQFDEDDWEPVENQLHFGYQRGNVAADSGFGYEFGASISNADETLGSFREVTATIAEGFGGFRYEPQVNGAVQPFGGLGASLAYGRVKAGAGGEASDTNIGLYLHGGLHAAVTDRTTMIFDLRYRTGGELEVNGFDVNVDFLVLAVGFVF